MQTYLGLTVYLKYHCIFIKFLFTNASIALVNIGILSAYKILLYSYKYWMIKNMR